MSVETSNQYKVDLQVAAINLVANPTKIILMASGFVWDPAAHSKYSDIQLQELPTGFGYIRGAKVLANPVQTKDDTNNLAKVDFDDAQWLPSGGDIGPSPGAALIADNDTVIGYKAFGSDQTASDGGQFNARNIVVRNL